ncbi:DUF58 domain-containing protein [Cellulomonas soli]|uniref:DUF58 domain-containing protein n=1 Tax=Cellulomonas soli TaxID=931535 RepID=A0A512PAR2_9CELL|nr:DUF58 domain-containing protein [Cellulomonas soli]NYI57434.1 uncharacterized protein (DUF58 family) [Cellulomonas soli]GEP68285.1 hypothetical protein CSO01_10000 [Cellulomonas soli]
MTTTPGSPAAPARAAHDGRDARPGRRDAATDRLLRRLEWRVVRPLEGRLQGAYRTTQRGSGFDLAGLRAYVEGDDARHIDWNVTARMNEPHVREFTEDRELTVWLVLDRSTSMAAGVPGRGKDDVLVELALVLTRLFARGGNRVGAVLYDTGAVRVVRPGSGRTQALLIGEDLARTAPHGRTGEPAARGARRRRGRSAASAPGTDPAPGTTTDLAAMLASVASVARRRSLVLVVSDLIGTGEWERPLLQLAHRHEVVALRIVDAADDDVPQAGLVVVEDAETGEQLFVDTSDPLFRARLRAGVDARDAAILAGTRRAGVPVHRITTDRDLVGQLVDVVARTQARPA